MKMNQKSILLLFAFIMVITIILLYKMGLKKAVEDCENHHRTAEVELRILSWNVTCVEK
ncbi:hypothetical protein [Bacillus sp. BHET2]|uniref:hypothetical protein n=1 Tax=Bacillus sp. BHET2 TaxID=2583818 RepID=UPI0014862236|nr:hypothetical protein [Bacillus sp. BHET2]